MVTQIHRLIMHRDGTVESRTEEDNTKKVRYIDKFLTRAVMKGNARIVRVLIALGADPSFGDDAPARASVYFNHPEILKFLLQDDRIDKNKITEYAMSWGIKVGYDEILNVVLNSKEVDPTANNRPIKYALACGRMDIVNKLVKDERFVDALMNEDETRSQRMTI